MMKKKWRSSRLFVCNFFKCGALRYAIVFTLNGRINHNRDFFLFQTCQRDQGDMEYLLNFFMEGFIQQVASLVRDGDLAPFSGDRIFYHPLLFVPAVRLHLFGTFLSWDRPF